MNPSVRRPLQAGAMTVLRVTAAGLAAYADTACEGGARATLGGHMGDHSRHDPTTVGLPKAEVLGGSSWTHP